MTTQKQSEKNKKDKQEQKQRKADIKKRISNLESWIQSTKKQIIDASAAGIAKITEDFTLNMSALKPASITLSTESYVEELNKTDMSFQTLADQDYQSAVDVENDISQEISG